MILSNKNHKRLHTNENKTKKSLNISTISDKTLYSHSLVNHQSAMSDTPLLSFTSFQHYLEECNQNDFYKKQHQKHHRSTSNTKTQAYFKYQRQKTSTSQQQRSRFRNITLENSVVEPFQVFEGTSIRNKSLSYKKSRNNGLRSESENYVKEGCSIAEQILREKFGKLEGWNSQLKADDNNSSKTFVSSKNVLQERKLTSTKNRILKSSQNSIRKQKISQSVIQTNQESQPHQKISKFMKSSNKQNFQSSTQIKKNSASTWNINENSSQDQLFSPIQITQKPKMKNCPLTSINELQEEILMSRRDQIILSESSGRHHQNNQAENVQNNQLKQQVSHLKMLKKEFEYLCKEDVEEENWQEYHKSSSCFLENSHKNKGKAFKPFRKFPNYEDKQNSTCYPFDFVSQLPLYSNRPKTTPNENNQSSPNMMRILKSINYPQTKTQSNYEPKVSKERKSTMNEFSTPNNKSNDMRSASKQKEKFNLSLRDKKSQSAFHSISKDTLCGNLQQNNESRVLKSNKNLLNQGESDKNLSITVVSSFKSCGLKQRNNRPKWNSKNYSLLKSIKSRLLTEQQTSKLDHLLEIESSEKYGDPNNENVSRYQINEMMVSEFRETQNIDDFHTNQSTLKLSVDQSDQVSQQANQHTQITQLSQNFNQQPPNLKKPFKIPANPSNLNANKRFIHFNNVSKINRNRNKSNTSKTSNKNLIEKLTITQLEGRHIQQLRKRFDFLQ